MDKPRTGDVGTYLIQMGGDELGKGEQVWYTGAWPPPDRFRYYGQTWLRRDLWETRTIHRGRPIPGAWYERSRVTLPAEQLQNVAHATIDPEPYQTPSPQPDPAYAAYKRETAAIIRKAAERIEDAFSKGVIPEIEGAIPEDAYAEGLARQLGHEVRRLVRQKQNAEQKLADIADLLRAYQADPQAHSPTLAGLGLLVFTISAIVDVNMTVTSDPGDKGPESRPGGQNEPYSANSSEIEGEPDRDGGRKL